MTLKKGLVTIEVTEQDGNITIEILSKGKRLHKRTLGPAQFISKIVNKTFISDLDKLLWPELYIIPIEVTCDYCDTTFYTRNAFYICPTCKVKVISDEDVEQKIKEQLNEH